MLHQSQCLPCPAAVDIGTVNILWNHFVYFFPVRIRLDFLPFLPARFDLVQKTMQACTALAFTLHRKSEFLVALADYSVKCFDKGTHCAFSDSVYKWCQ